MNEYVMALGGLSLATMAATEGVGRVVKIRKDLAALVIGPVAGLGAYGAGFLPTPNPGLWGWGFAAMMGLFGTLGGGLLNDYVAKAMQKPKEGP